VSDMIPSVRPGIGIELDEELLNIRGGKLADYKG